MTRLRRFAATCVLTAALTGVVVAPAGAGPLTDTLPHGSVEQDDWATSVPASASGAAASCGVASTKVNKRAKPSPSAELLGTIAPGTSVCGDLKIGAQYTTCGHTSTVWLRIPGVKGLPTGFSPAWCFV